MKTELDILDAVRALYTSGRVTDLSPLFSGVRFSTLKGDGELKNGMLNADGRMISVSASDITGFAPVAAKPAAVVKAEVKVKASSKATGFSLD